MSIYSIIRFCNGPILEAPLAWLKMYYGQEVEMYDESYMLTGMEFIVEERYVDSDFNVRAIEIDASDPNKVGSLYEWIQHNHPSIKLIWQVFDEDGAFLKYEEVKPFPTSWCLVGYSFG